MSSNLPENISLKDLLSSVPGNCEINVPHLDITSETGVSPNAHNYTTMMEEPFENKSHIYRKHLRQFPNKLKHLNGSAVKKHRNYNQSIILKTLHSKALIKGNKIMVHNSKQELNNHDGSIDSQNSINKSLVEAADSENHTRDDLEENPVHSNVSQRVILKKLHNKSSNIMAHSSQHNLNNNNGTINNESNIKKNLSDALMSNVSGEVYGNHEMRDVYYVVHTCSQKRCRIHQVLVLKRGIVQEEDLEAILQTNNQSQYSPYNGFGGLNGWQESYSAIISGMLLPYFKNIQWLLTAMFSLAVALLTKLICGIYNYKKKIDITHLFMEESISDITELADILKNYTTAQLILERRIVLACRKETDNATQITNMKNEIENLKIAVQSMDGSNSVNMDDFLTEVLNYLQNCLESGADSCSESRADSTSGFPME